MYSIIFICECKTTRLDVFLVKSVIVSKREEYSIEVSL